jgi:galactonate dehydratase
MRITGLETFVVPPRWCFLKISTDEGIAGWGEPVLEGHAATVAAQVAEYADLLIGQDPCRINDIWQMLYRNGCYRGGNVLMSAMAGIDTALWDISARALGVPIHRLLGGALRDRVRSYRWIGGDRPRDLIAGAKALRAEGYDCAKFNVCDELQIIDSHAQVDAILWRLGDLRTAVGADMDLAFDFHGRVHLPMARVLLREIEPLRPLFVEDAVPADLLAEAASLRSAVPLCFGERLHSRGEFRALFEGRFASVTNPDPAHVGGISETLRIGHMAEACDVALAPHCPLGPVALAACLQIDALCHNAVLQEQSLGIHYNADGDLLDYLVPGGGFAVVGGFIEIPQGPGLGIEVDEAAVRRAAAGGHRWRAPVWRHGDGSVAEW